MYSHEQAILYMKDMTRILGNDVDAMYFYLARAKAMYLDRWYPREDARKDLDRAREIADGIATKCRRQNCLLFGSYRANITNWQLYFPIRDWLEGHPLPRDETSRLQKWANELRDLLKEDWAKQDKYEWTDPADRNLLVPAAFDTLGMSELAIGISTNNLSRERCAQAAADLSIAKEIFHRRLVLYPANYQDALRISEAHKELRDSLCGQ
jgi:hypothetical protein